MEMLDHSKKTGDTIFILESEKLLLESGISPCNFASSGVFGTTSGIPSFTKPFTSCFIPIASITPSGALSARIAPEFHPSFVELIIEESSRYTELFRQGYQRGGFGKVGFNNKVPVSNEILSNQTRIGTIPYGFDNFRSRPDSYSSFNEFFSQSSWVDFIFSGQTTQGSSRVVFVDEIVEVGNESYSNHVFDLQSDDSIIIAENPESNNTGILVSNCQCTPRLEYGLQDQDAEGYIEEYNSRVNEYNSQ